MTYGGVCNSLCLDCNGETDYDCLLCSPHCHKDYYGRCIMDVEYSGNGHSNSYSSSSPYSQTHAHTHDHSYNDYFSTNGPTSEQEYYANVNVPNLHSHFNSTTNNSHVHCHALCDDAYGCSGPDPEDCNRCVEHAYFNNNSCCCMPYWSGTHCENSDMHCDPICHGCSGPSAHDCNECVPNAEMKYG